MTAAIAGLGITEMGKIYGRSAADFAAEAVALALDDAGLEKCDIDGLLINGNGNVDMEPRLQMALGFEDLTMLNVMSAAGSTSGAMVQYAALALDAGVVNKWARMNPHAQMTKPMTLEEHQSSRLIVDPFHLFDCCLVSNGAVAVIMTTAERAKHLRQPPVYVRAAAQAAPGDNQRTGRNPGIDTGAKRAGELAFSLAGITRDDVDILELYDCYTYTVLVTLEDYGFCEKGEGGAFVEDGKLGPGGSLPTNTGGGQLSAYYMWGFTPLSEAVIQARGQGGERQVERNDIVLASGNGGVLNYHSTAILSKHAA